LNGACHDCRHSAAVGRGEYAATPWGQTPCADCLARFGDSKVDKLEQGHGRILSYNDCLAWGGDGEAVDGEVEEAVEVEADTEAEEDAGGEEAAILRPFLYAVARMKLGQVVALWNALRGGTLRDAAEWLGISRVAVRNHLLHGLRELGVEGNVFARKDSPERLSWMREIHRRRGARK